MNTNASSSSSPKVFQHIISIASHTPPPLSFTYKTYNILNSYDALELFIFSTQLWLRTRLWWEEQRKGVVYGVDEEGGEGEDEESVEDAGDDSHARWAWVELWLGWDWMVGRR